LIWLLASHQTSGWAENFTGQLQFAEGSYRINVGDVLSVNVYNQSDLSANGILVRSDGNASFNGIGEIQVAGKTIRETTQLLESQVRELVREPRISLTVSESKPPSVYLAGAVMRPGMLQAGNSTATLSNTTNNTGGLSGGNGSGISQNGSGASGNRMDFRLSSVLSAAGGVKLSADLANVTVTRDGQLYKTVNLWDLLKNGSSDNDLMLQNGDSVYVPALPHQALDDATYQLLLSSAIGPQVFPVRIIGDVKTPGVYDLNSTSPYLNSAIAKGGGFNYGANIKVVAIRRFSGENKFSTLMVDPNRHDFMLRPNDVVYVSEQKIYKTGRFADNAAKVLSPFTNMASAVFGLAVLGGIR
jgi:polysaccharide export outer membrane protein